MIPNPMQPNPVASVQALALRTPSREWHHGVRALLVTFAVSSPALADTQLEVDLSTTIGPATHVGSGSLYGITEDLPADVDGLVAPLAPKMFTNPAANIQQPHGDAFLVAARLAPVGATVTIRLADLFPGWPYQFSNMTDWLDKLGQTAARKQDSGLDNFYGYEIWNEPTGTWTSSTPFNDFWKQSFDELRTLDPTAPIIGPSISYYNASWLQDFLTFARDNDCLPDIVSWHELSGGDVGSHFSAYRTLEQDLGIGPLPISINEYSGEERIDDEGQPGASAPLIAKFERFGVDTACISYWDVPNPGRLGSLLATNTDRNGGWWFYKWYGDMSGDMVSTQGPSPNDVTTLDGFANLDAAEGSASVLFAGVNDGTVSVVFRGFAAAAVLGNEVHVVVEQAPWGSRTTPVNQTTTLSTDDLTITNDELQITVPNTNNQDGYRITLTSLEIAPVGAGGAGGASTADGGTSNQMASGGTPQGTGGSMGSMTGGQPSTAGEANANAGAGASPASAGMTSSGNSTGGQPPSSPNGTTGGLSTSGNVTMPGASAGTGTTVTGGNASNTATSSPSSSAMGSSATSATSTAPAVLGTEDGTSTDSGGCSVRPQSSSSSPLLPFAMTLFGLLFLRRVRGTSTLRQVIRREVSKKRPSPSRQRCALTYACVLASLALFLLSACSSGTATDEGTPAGSTASVGNPKASGTIVTADNTGGNAPSGGGATALAGSSGNATGNGSNNGGAPNTQSTSTETPSTTAEAPTMLGSNGSGTADSSNNGGMQTPGGTPATGGTSSNTGGSSASGTDSISPAGSTPDPGNGSGNGGTSGTDSAGVVIGSLALRGLSLSCAEWGTNLPGTFNTDYTYPDPQYVPGYDSANYYVSKNVTVFRLPFLWERLQPTLSQDFNPDELTRLDTTVTNLLATGAYVILDLHNYARYNDTVIGSGSVTQAAFADIWSRFATKYGSNPKVIFGLMNEPHDIDNSVWVDAAQAAINAIRDTGTNNLILVASNGWSNVASWNTYADALLTITDSADNIAFEGHNYFNTDASASDTCMSSTIGAERIANFTTWLKTNNVRGFLGELSGNADDSNCQAAVTNTLQHISDNADVYLGWAWWAGGPWWGDNWASLEPDGTTDNVRMTWLLPFL